VESTVSYDIDWEFQHIAIAGISFCGSTLLSMMLGSLEGVDNIGESQKLIVNLETTEDSPDYASSLLADRIKPCKTCGPSCLVYAQDFRLALRENQEYWYTKIAHHGKSRILVSSDKNYHNIIRHDPGLKLDSIVLFKSPVTSCNSFYRKFIDPEFDNHSEFNFDRVSLAWLNSYKKFLDHYETNGQKVFLNFDRFSPDPDRHMRLVCEKFGLNYDPACLNSFAEGQHYFGGNRRVNKRYLEHQREHKIVASDQIVLPEEYVKKLEENSEVQDVYQRMMDHYESVFR